MTLFQLTPAMILNMFALLTATPGIWLLHVTRRREQRETQHLATLTEQSQVDEPMHVMSVPALRLNRLCYRVGGALLGLALLVSWISTKL